MYRKSMREALEEARAYTAVHEVKVSKGGRTLDISKDDLPVYKAKGWKLATLATEAKDIVLDFRGSHGNYIEPNDAFAVQQSMKRMGIRFKKIDRYDHSLVVRGTNDNESKMLDAIKKVPQYRNAKVDASVMEELVTDIEFDDVNEATVTIKSYDTKTGLDRQAEKQMNAVAQRAGVKVQKSGNNVYKVTGDNKKLSKFMANIDQIDGSFMTEESESVEKVKLYEFRLFKIYKDGKFVGRVRARDEKAAIEQAYMKLGSASRFTGAGRQSFKAVAEETELEERFTIGDFKRLEADNQHDIAAKKLIDMFGTPDEKKEIDAINKRHNKTGYITGPDFKKRTQIVNKYFSKLMP